VIREASRATEESSTEEARFAASQARAQASESRAASHGEAAEVKEFATSPELKNLYREVAKRVHPDLAIDEIDRERERLIKETNRAYQNGDADSEANPSGVRE
jgi:hypothetical protein